MSSGAARCRSRASSIARRCRTCCASGAACRRRRGSPRPSASSPRRRASAASAASPGARSTVHDFLHAKLVVCDDWAFAGSYNHSRAGEENAENVLAMDGKAVRRSRRRGDPRVRRALRAGRGRLLGVRRRPDGSARPSTTTARGPAPRAPRGAAPARAPAASARARCRPESSLERSITCSIPARSPATHELVERRGAPARGPPRLARSARS